MFRFTHRTHCIASPFLLLVFVALVALSTERFGQSPTHQVKSEQSPAGLTMMTITVVNDRNELVQGLSRENFSIIEDKAPRQIAFFGNSDEPTSVAFVVDASGSMLEYEKQDASGSLERILDQSNQANEYSVIGFANSPELLLERSREPGAVRSALKTLGASKTKGQSALFDACKLALDTVGQSRYSKKMLIVVSDGMDNKSQLSFSKFSQLLKGFDATVYAIWMGDSDTMSTAMGIQGKDSLNELAAISGGLLFLPSSKRELNSAVDRVAYELRHQYRIGFEPSPTDSKSRSRKVTVKVKAVINGKVHNAFTARARKDVLISAE